MLYLATARFVTGAVLTVDGGWTARDRHLGLDLGGSAIKGVVLEHDGDATASCASTRRHATRTSRRRGSSPSSARSAARSRREVGGSTPPA